MGITRPAERLAVVRRAMEHLKGSRQAQGAQFLTSVENALPPAVLARASRLGFSSRMYNLLVTNVPRPAEPIYLLGRELVELAPLAFLAPEHLLAVAIVSYHGSVTYGLLGDADALPDLDDLAGHLRDALAELVAAARAAGLTATVRRARTADVPQVRDLVDTWTPTGGCSARPRDPVRGRAGVLRRRGRRPAGRLRGAARAWADLAEVRTLAVDPSVQGTGVGHALLERLVEQARDLGVAGSSASPSRRLLRRGTASRGRRVAVDAGVLAGAAAVPGRGCRGVPRLARVQAPTRSATPGCCSAWMSRSS